MAALKTAKLIFPAFIVFSILFVLSDASSAAERVFVKEYTYQASEADSKLTSRAIAVERAKRLVLDELGAYLTTKTVVKDFAIASDKIPALAAGVVRIDISDERWGGKKYYLKARIKADPDEAAKAIDKLRKDDGRTRELNDAKKRGDEALKEIERLKSGLDAAGNARAKQLAFVKQADVLLATDWFYKGLAYYDSKKHDRAIEAFSKAIELDPSYAYAYSNRGNEHVRRGRHDKAIEDFNKAISLKPDDAYAYRNRGNAHGMKGSFDRAIEDFGKAISLKPDYAEAYSNRGYAHGMKGSFDRAIEDFGKAISLRPDYAEAYFSRGTAYGMKGRMDMAIEDYNWAVSLRPDYAEAYYNRGFAYNMKGQYDKAIENQNRAISLKPDYALAYNNRGHAYNMKGQYDKALADFKKGCGLGSDVACKNIRVVEGRK